MAEQDWHIEKRVTWGHMISTIVLGAALLTAWDDIGDRVDAHEIEIKYVQEKDLSLEAQYFDLRKENREQYKAISEKLDSLILRGVHQ